MARQPKPAASQATPDETQADESAAAPAEATERHVSLRITATLAARLQMHAFATDATPSEVVADLIRTHVPEYGPKASA